MFQEIAGYGVEDSVEEVDGLGGGIAAGYFEGLVNDDGGGGVGEAEHLGYGGADEVAVDDGHALDAPVLGVGLDEGVDLLLPGGGYAVEIFGKTSSLGVYVVDGGPEEFADFVGSLLTEVALEEHLHGEFAGLAAGAHYSKNRLSEFCIVRIREHAQGLKPPSRTVGRDPRRPKAEALGYLDAKTIRSSSPDLFLATSLPSLSGQLALDGDHFDGGDGGFEALVSGFETGAVESLL